MAKNQRATPAERAKSRRNPAVFKPPPGVKAIRRSPVRELRLYVAGRTYPIGVNIEGDTPWSMGMDQTAVVTLSVRDPEGKLAKIMKDEALLQHTGVRTTIDGIHYVVQSIEADGSGLYSMTVEDEVSWRLKRFDKFRSASRARSTRFGFIQSFIKEASRKPYPRLRSFIPEVDDKRRPLKPKRTDD